MADLQIQQAKKEGGASILATNMCAHEGKGVVLWCFLGIPIGNHRACQLVQEPWGKNSNITVHSDTHSSRV